MYNNNILNIAATAVQDNSIIKNECYTYTPYTVSYEENDEIRIAIPHQDAYLLPCDSYLYVRFVVKTENNKDDVTDKVKYVHNFPSFLFSEARYELNGVEVDRIKNVGIASTIKLASATSDKNMVGYYEFNQAFTRPEKFAQSNDEKTYDVMIPLKIWFGFLEDYQNVVLHSSHQLILLRSRNSLDCVWGGTETAGSPNVTISVSKIEWKMPYITLADDIKLDMKNYLAKNKRLVVQYRAFDLYEYPELPQTTDLIWSVKTVSHIRKPRFVLVAFQHDKRGKKIENPSLFQYSHITKVRLHLNSHCYPYLMHDVDISKGRFSELYEAYANIQSSYFNHAQCINQFAINYCDFQKNSIFAFDVSRSEETNNSKCGNETVDIRLEIKSSENLLPKTSAFCLIIYDNQFVYSPVDKIVERCIL